MRLDIPGENHKSWMWQATMEKVLMKYKVLDYGINYKKELIPATYMETPKRKCNPEHNN